MATSGAYMLLRHNPDKAETNQNAQPASKGYVDDTVEKLHSNLSGWVSYNLKDHREKISDLDARLTALEEKNKQTAKAEPAKEKPKQKESKKKETPKQADQAKLSRLAPAQQEKTMQQQMASPQYDQYGQDPAQPQQQVYAQQNQQQADPVVQQPLYVQQPVVIEGYGTLGVGYTIPACPWSQWQSPLDSYPYAVCYGGWGWNNPYLWWNGGRGWGRGFYGARDFGRYFGRNIASRSYARNNYGATARASGSASRSGEGGWGRPNGQHGGQQSRDSKGNAPNMQRPNISNMLRQQHNQFNQLHNQQMPHQAPQQHMQQQAPSYHSQASASHAGGPGVGSREGRRR